MEIINTEIIISTLLLIGFDRVDPYLFSCVLGNILMDNVKNKLFEFKGAKTIKASSQYINYDGSVFTMNEEGFEMINAYLSKNNRKLIKYLSDLDYGPIIIRKIEKIGLESITEKEYLFSPTEKEILYVALNLKDRKIPFIELCKAVFGKTGKLLNKNNNPNT